MGMGDGDGGDTAQGPDRLGEGLRPVAWATDEPVEVVEAVELSGHDVIGVQWHPEHMAATDQHQRALFAAFVRRARTGGDRPSKENVLCPTT